MIRLWTTSRNSGRLRSRSILRTGVPWRSTIYKCPKASTLALLPPIWPLARVFGTSQFFGDLVFKMLICSGYAHSKWYWRFTLFRYNQQLNNFTSPFNAPLPDGRAPKKRVQAFDLFACVYRAWKLIRKRTITFWIRAKSHPYIVAAFRESTAPQEARVFFLSSEGQLEISR